MQTYTYYGKPEAEISQHLEPQLNTQPCYDDRYVHLINNDPIMLPWFSFCIVYPYYIAFRRAAACGSSQPGIEGQKQAACALANPHSPSLQTLHMPMPSRSHLGPTTASSNQSI
jgi:hypothetical protein